MPVQAAYDLGAEIIIAVDLFGHRAPPTLNKQEKETPETTNLSFNSALNYLHSLSEKLPFNIFPNSSNDKIKTVIDVIEHTSAITQRHLTTLRLKEYPASILIQPEVSEVGILDFHRGEKGVKIGEAAAQEMLPAIETLLSELM